MCLMDDRLALLMWLSRPFYGIGPLATPSAFAPAGRLSGCKSSRELLVPGNKTAIVMEAIVGMK